jgi:hypothetical protein
MINDAQLMMFATPIDAGERGRIEQISHLVLLEEPTPTL